MAHPNSMFGWADLATPDTAAAAEFYGEVLGWDTVVTPGGMPYSFFMKDGRNAAGMGELSAEQVAGGQPPVWSSYIAVDEADTVLARAVELGAEVMMPAMDVMDTGRMAFLVDPTGATFGLWQAGSHQGADALHEPGFMTWNELATGDVSSAVAFYGELFGWEAVTEDTDGFVYTTFMRADRPNCGTYDMTPYVPAGTPPHWAVYFAVDDADAAVESARRLGATITRGPADSPFGRMAAMVDPLGADFSIIARTRVA